jgi:hypothetical protein
MHASSAIYEHNCTVLEALNRVLFAYATSSDEVDRHRNPSQRPCTRPTADLCTPNVSSIIAKSRSWQLCVILSGLSFRTGLARVNTCRMQLQCFRNTSRYASKCTCSCLPLPDTCCLRQDFAANNFFSMFIAYQHLLGKLSASLIASRAI